MATFAVKAGTVGVATADDVKAAINNRDREAHRRTHAGRNRRQGPARHQARRLHRVVDSGLLGGHARTRPIRTFKSPAEIEALWRGKGVAEDRRVTVYCQVGMRASHDLFTLALLGHDLTKLTNYYGAWEEWGNRDDTPIKNRD